MPDKIYKLWALWSHIFIGNVVGIQVYIPRASLALEAWFQTDLLMGHEKNNGPQNRILILRAPIFGPRAAECSLW